MEPGQEPLGKPDFRQTNRFNWVTFTVCLILAIVLWVLVILSKIHQVTMKFPVRFTDAPPEISLVLKNTEEVSLQVRANGFNLFLNYLLKPLDTLELSLSENREKPYYLTNRNLKAISQTLPYTLEAVDAKPDTLFFLFDSKGKKKVPILNRVQINWDGSWMPLAKPEITPDSVTLYGSAEDLKKIKYWETAQQVFENASGNLDEIIPLDTARNIIPQPASVKFSVKAAEFTQASRTLKVSVQNVPGKKRIRLIPDTVHIAYLVPMDKFEEAAEAPFSVEVDFSRLRQDQEYVIPKIRQQPDFVKDITISPERIRFVITNLRK